MAHLWDYPSQYQTRRQTRHSSHGRNVKFNEASLIRIISTGIARAFRPPARCTVKFNARDGQLKPVETSLQLGEWLLDSASETSMFQPRTNTEPVPTQRRVEENDINGGVSSNFPVQASEPCGSFELAGVWRKQDRRYLETPLSCALEMGGISKNCCFFCFPLR
ncbi:two component system sensor histidine kinase, GAF region [Anopheles sinensis]|uniref:Two component system sensor histidine kinase, GAF region n=1 Tax=Anopheles sinensis TaxID=74873 RepID=A0A084VS64_ANOSI|nr:two component system sensor histidine kinase, GAF region [Anopheles sinensis]